MHARKGSSRRVAALFAAPALLAVGFYLVYPALHTIFLSFLDRGLTTWVGLDNYVRLFTADATRTALRNNLLWLVTFTALTVGLGLLMAVLTDGLRYETIARSIMFMPMAISFAGAGVIWKFMYAFKPAGEAQIGLLNGLRTLFGAAPIGWLVERPWINNFALIAVGVWMWTGFAMVILSAAYKGIPREMIEAARVDGANEWRVFFHVSLPAMGTTVAVVTTTMIINVLKIFDVIYVMTNGSFGTEVLANRMYKEMFQFRNYSGASAIAVVLFVAVLPMMAMNVRRLYGTNGGGRRPKGGPGRGGPNGGRGWAWLGRVGSHLRHRVGGRAEAAHPSSPGPTDTGTFGQGPDVAGLPAPRAAGSDQDRIDSDQQSPTPGRVRWTGMLSRAVRHGVVLAVIFVWLLPVLGLLISSVRPAPDVAATGWWTVLAKPFDASQYTLDNYRHVLLRQGMGQAFRDSFLITVPATLLPMLLAAFAAYAFSWLPLRGRGLWFALVVALLVVPLQMTLIPVLRVYSNLGLAGSLPGIWLAHTGYGLPFAIYLLRNFFSSLPKDLFEAAAIDGATPWGTFFRLVLPMSTPALASLAIFQFLWVWNDLLVALIYLGGSAGISPLTLKLSTLVGSFGQEWHVLMAAAFVTMAVPLVVFFALQRFFVRGILAGAVKG